MRITIVAAMGRNRVIGTATGLPWHLPRDLKQFRALTVGKPIILGRTTFDHIGRPLPDRPNIVLTRQADFAPAGVHIAHSPEEALAVADQLGATEVMVVGGAEVYRAFLPRADRLCFTIVEGEFAGTTSFPLDALDGHSYSVRRKDFHAADDRNPHTITFWELERNPDATVPTNLPELLGVS